jgi:hypothetical protein
MINNLSNDSSANENTLVNEDSLISVININENGECLVYLKLKKI